MNILSDFNPIAFVFSFLFLGVCTYCFYAFGIPVMSEHHLGGIKAMGLIYLGSVLMIALCFYIVMKISK
jgi:hypothetical protein